MAITLIVNNVPIDYPEQGEEQPWGESATNWAVEVTKVLSSLKGPSDIAESTAIINPLQIVEENIPGLFFNSNTVRMFTVTGAIVRTTDVDEKYEQYDLVGLYRGPTLGWTLQQESIGDDSLVVFSITPSGQVQYTCSALSGNQATYSGTIKFKAIGISQL